MNIQKSGHVLFVNVEHRDGGKEQKLNECQQEADFRFSHQIVDEQVVERKYLKVCRYVPAGNVAESTRSEMEHKLRIGISMTRRRACIA